MRQLIEVTFISLDGVIDAPNIVNEAMSYSISDQEYQQDARNLLFGADALLLGRKTYEHFARAYPGMGSSGRGALTEFVSRMNEIPKYVASTTLTELTWNATLLAGDVAQEVLKLKQQPGRSIVKYGTGVLDHTLLQHGLIDVLRIYLFPFVMGGGIHLFEKLGHTEHFELADVTRLKSGTLILSYGCKR